MERIECARLRPGAELWVEDTGERVLYKWLTLEGVRCATGAGDRTYWLDELLTAPPAPRTKRGGKGARGKATQRRAAAEPLPTAAQMGALDTLASGEIELWYHDLGARTADALLAKGWVRETGRVRCSRCTTAHPGALEITDEGRAALMLSLQVAA